MTWDLIKDILVDSVLDASKVFLVAFIFNVVLSFVEGKISKGVTQSSKAGPILGSLSGLIPQCGVSIVAADLYVKEHITIGTLFAVFFACSDEALPIVISNASGTNLIYLIVLIGVKFLFGFVFGYLLDLIIRKSIEKVNEHKQKCNHEEVVHVGCCHHEIDNEKESKIHKHFVHPLLHSLKIFGYILIIGIVFGLLINLIGEDNINSFVISTKYLSPIFTSIVGLIPNCASSILLSDLFVEGKLTFGALLSGLCVNAGLGGLYLIKNLKDKKNIFVIYFALLITSLFAGYMAIFIEWLI